MRDYMRDRRHADPEFAARQKQAKADSRERHREWFYGVLAEFRKDGCKTCEEKDPCCLSAHHVRGKKSFSISKVFSMHAGRQKILKELAKCVCVCENCHRKIHAGKLVLTAEQKAA